LRLRTRFHLLDRLAKLVENPATHQIWLVGFALVWLFQAFTLGMSDDEAYYWVLSQNPSWGYAYHPPMIAWSMAAVDWITGIFWALLGGPTELAHPGRMRLGAVAMSLFIFGMSLRWARTIVRQEQNRELTHSEAALLVLPGLAAAGWMSVPDLPLFVGWWLAFLGAWHPEKKQAPVLLFFGALVGLLSKFSAVLFIGSAALSVIGYAPRAQRLRLLGALALGSTLALLPTLWWNLHNDWASIRYQFIERHQSGGHADGARYLRFWASQLLIAGPALIAALAILKPKRGLVLLWFAPAAAVFLVQPLFSEFKAHWALAAWLPLSLWIATHPERPGWLARLHAGWTLSLITLWIALCQLPLQAKWTEWWTQKKPNPLWDITNDFFGWSELAPFIEEKTQGKLNQLPVLGARYQTASQAAFALQGRTPGVSLVGRGQTELQEWPRLNEWLIHDSGQTWPTLKKPVLFVADNRYSAGPAFRNSSCEDLGELQTRRADYLAKSIRLWLCSPEVEANP
jgi:hypothetical protein